MSKQKIIIKINGKDYSLICSETQEYMEKVAKHVDQKISEIALSNSQLNMQMVAILASINIADEYYKSVDATDNLRMQVGQYIDDVSKDRTELCNLKAENQRLKKELESYQNKDNKYA